MMRLTSRAVAVAAAFLPLVLGVGGTASAQGTQGYITRGQYVEQLLQAVGIQPDTAATQNFSDVPTSSPYYGWVEAAYRAGITTGMTAPQGSAMGVFGVGDDLTRAEAAAFDLRAYDQGVADYAQDPRSWTGNGKTWNPNDPAYHGQAAFSDYAQIPGALQGDVYIAASIGLLHGFPNGTFGPQQNLTAAQTTDLIAQLKSVEAAGSGAITWRWIGAATGLPSGTCSTSCDSLDAEHRAVNAMDFLASAIEGRPFSAVSGYIEPSDATALQTTYTEIQANWRQNFASKDSSIVWKVVGGNYVVGVSAPQGDVDDLASVVVEATSSSGAPVTTANIQGLGGVDGPYMDVMLSGVTTDANNLVSRVGSPWLNKDNSETLPKGASVAGVVMQYDGGAAGINDFGMAIAVVGGLGEAVPTGN